MWTHSLTCGVLGQQQLKTMPCLSTHSLMDATSATLADLTNKVATNAATLMCTSAARVRCCSVAALYTHAHVLV
jgi:hypothetical protein